MADDQAATIAHVFTFLNDSASAHSYANDRRGEAELQLRITLDAK